MSLQLLGGEQAVETFSVTVSDGELTDVSTLTITVDGVDDATVFFGDTAFTIDQDVSSQIFPVQGVLSSFDVDQHAVIAPVDAGQGTYGVFGFQPSSDVDGVDGSDPVEQPPNGSAFELPFQVIRPDTPVIDQQTGTVTVDLNYEVDDPNALRLAWSCKFTTTVASSKTQYWCQMRLAWSSSTMSRILIILILMMPPIE